MGAQRSPSRWRTTGPLAIVISMAVTLVSIKLLGKERPSTPDMVSLAPSSMSLRGASIESLRIPFKSVDSFSCDHHRRQVDLRRNRLLSLSENPGVWRAPPEKKTTEPQLASKQLKDLRVGDQFKGKIVAVKPFGAFVDIGYEKDGLLLKADVRRFFRNKEPEFGDLVDVKVSEVDLQAMRFRCDSVVQEPKLNTDHISEGAVVEGTVKYLTNFGVFVDIGAGKDGLLHSSWLKSIAFADGVPVIGEKIKVSIQKIDVEKNRLILGAPGKEGKVPTRPPPREPDVSLDKYRGAVNSQKFKARVLSLKPYGAILALEDGVRGLLPLRFASPDRINSVAEVMGVGDSLDVYVLGIDDRGISFSLRPITGRQAPERRTGPSKKVKTSFSVGGMSFNIGKEAQEAAELIHGKGASIPNAAPSASSASRAATAAKEQVEEPGDEEVEVEEREYKGVIYLVDPSTNELYTEEGEVVGEWEGEEPVFF